MSDIRKWIKIMESIPSTLLDQDPTPVVIKKDATVMISPSAGGGTARYMHSTPQGAMVDIKGVTRELAHNDFSLPSRDYEDPYENGNAWNHSTEEENTIGSMNDKPEFRSGDLVKVDDVYGNVIGPGFGVFISYSTSGQECIISFDNKQIVVPTAQVGAVLEQNAKDNFSQTDNDGNLSPMSLGSENVKIEKEPAMDQRDEFSKWMSAVEEALSTEGPAVDKKSDTAECGCNNWDCPTCFPTDGIENDMNDIQADDMFGESDPVMDFTASGGKVQQLPYMNRPRKPGQSFGSKHIGSATGSGNRSQQRGAGANVSTPGHPSIKPVVGEEDQDAFDIEQDSPPAEKSRSGKGVKLGDIVTKTEFRKTGGDKSPMTYGDDNLAEGPDEVDYDAQEDMEMGSPLNRQDFQNEMSDIDPDEAMEKISQITYMQDMGLSNSSDVYDEDQLANMTADELRKVHQQVTGNDAASGEMDEELSPKPTKPKTKTYNPLDDLEDVLNPPTQFNAPATIGGSDDDNEVQGDEPPMVLPSAGRDATRQRTANIRPDDEMRGWMNRINPAAGQDEPALPDAPENELIVRTASDVPAVISNAIRASGMESPEWHGVRDLPGFQDSNIRGMGRSVFGMFTSTPVEQIQTIANVQGQGPNTDSEMRAVAAWLRNNATDLGDIDIDHGMAIPGYKPDVKEYSANGVRFHVVRDPMGQYIYAYPDKDARLGSPAGQQRGRIGHGRNVPRLGESIKEDNMKVSLKPTLFEQLKWDEEINAILKRMPINEEELEESSLSKLIGKQRGGQRLVQWLHRKHKLGNDADLQPQPFNERMLWKEFKRNPDNFVVVSATGGVAGIKPYEQQIRDRMEAARKKGKEYDPGGDSTLQYQIIAFTDDGQQVDPTLLQPARQPGEEREADPTVMKARMGKINGRDMQNPDNVFNLLADQIGSLRTVYLAGGAVERDKIKGRADMKQEPDFNEQAAMQKILNRVRPVLKTLANQALSQIINRSKRYSEGGNFEAAAKIAQSGAKLKQFLATIDTSGEVAVYGPYGTGSHNLYIQLKKALQRASGNASGPEYKEFLKRAANGSSVELKPVLDSLRDSLVALD